MSKNKINRIGDFKLSDVLHVDPEEIRYRVFDYLADFCTIIESCTGLERRLQIIRAIDCLFAFYSIGFISTSFFGSLCSFYFSLMED